MEADAECEPCDPITSNSPGAWCSFPSHCFRLQCMSYDGTGCGTMYDIYGSLCNYCSSFYANYMSTFQKLRLASDSSATVGDIVAEVLAETYSNGWSSVQSKTLLIQCIQTAGNAKNLESSWVPKEDSTDNACGLTVGQWLRGPEDTGYAGDYQTNMLFGKITSIDAPNAVFVKSDTLLPFDWKIRLKLSTSIPGVVSGVATDLAGKEVIHERFSSFPGNMPGPFHRWP